MSDQHPLDELAARFDESGMPSSAPEAVPEPEDNKEIPMDVEDPKKKRSSNWDRGSPGSGGPKQSAPPPHAQKREAPPPMRSQQPEGPPKEDGLVVYLLGVPLDCNGATLKENMMSHFNLNDGDFKNKITPVAQKNNNQQCCNYLKLQVYERETINTIIMNPSFRVMGHPVLCLPEIKDVGLEELVNLHQVTFQPQNTQRAPYGGNPDEIAAIYKFVAKFGNVVDMNMERWPHHCLVTYASAATSDYLIKLRHVQYKTAKNFSVRLLTSTSPVYDNNSVRNPIDVNESDYDGARIYRIRSKELYMKRPGPPPPAGP